MGANLPGQLAGASLKPEAERNHCADRAAKSPRPIGRGLIEATPRTAPSHPARLSPRPIGRGLIEAEQKVDYMIRTAYLPGQLAGASLKL